MDRNRIVLAAAIILCVASRVHYGLGSTQPYNYQALLLPNFPEHWIAMIDHFIYAVPYFRGLFLGTLALLGCCCVYFMSVSITGDERSGIVAVVLYTACQYAFSLFLIVNGELLTPILFVCSVFMYLMKDRPSAWDTAMMLAGTLVSLLIWNGGYYWVVLLCCLVAVKRYPVVLPLVPVIGVICMLMSFQGIVVAGYSPTGFDILVSILLLATLNVYFSPTYGIFIGISTLVLYALPLLLSSVRLDYANHQPRIVMAMVLFGLPFALASPFWDCLVMMPMIALSSTQLYKLML